MILPDRRNKYNVDVLLKATLRLPFFQNLMKEPAFEENNIHEELCKKMIMIDEVKGHPIIKRSKIP